MKPDELLLAAVDLGRDVPHDAPETGPLTWNDTDVERFVRMANHHRVAGLVGARLAASPGANVPPRIHEALRRALHRAKVRHLALAEEWKRIRGSFRKCDVDCIPLKGIELAHALYPDPGMRPCDDIDLLVREKDLARAREIMRDWGYWPPRALLPQPILKRFHFHLLLVHQTKQIPVEIHWRLMDRHALPPSATEAVWDRAERDAHGYPRIPPRLQAAYLAAHAGRHGYLNGRIAREEHAPALVLHPYTGLRLIWFVDLYLVMNSHGLSSNDVLDAAGQLGCRTIVHDTLAIANALFTNWPGPVPALDAARREGWLEARVKNRLMDRIRREQHDNQPFSTELPWVLTTNHRVHFRPIRLLGGRD